MAELKPAFHSHALGDYAATFSDTPQKPVSEWCCENLRFDEPDNRAPFTSLGREYIVEPLNEFSDPLILDDVTVFGSQSGKTVLHMGRIAWATFFKGVRVLWVMPNTDGLGGAKNFSNTRWRKMLMASPCFATKIPTGINSRTEWKTMHQRIGSSLIDFGGSNSPANLASIPARIIVLDEVDKFSEGTRKEADAVNLSEQRTKRFGDPKKLKSSTPTMSTGLIWQEFLKGDQRRYQIPCPACGRMILLVWSLEYTVLKETGIEGYVHWDKEAKLSNGTWDLERVKNSARVFCPHPQCLYKDFTDDKKTKAVRNGQWLATNTAAAKSFRSRHLSSLYASGPQTSFGAIAVQFLQAKSSLLGVQGFINGMLAEPYEMQDRSSRRTELIELHSNAPEEKGTNLMTIDCQRNAPYFWFVVRKWLKNKCIGLEAGPCDTEDELRGKQADHHVENCSVGIDSGFGARSEVEVYKMCARYSEMQEQENGRMLALGWMPMKGMPTRKRWKDPQTELMLPWHLQPIDPFMGTAHAGEVEMSLLEFSADLFKDVLESLRAGKGEFKWSLEQAMATEEYFRHLSGEIKEGKQSPRTGRVDYLWVRRGRHWPNHLLDCETEQLALASFGQMFNLETQDA